jgi:hypothetical protein
MLIEGTLGVARDPKRRRVLRDVGQPRWATSSALHAPIPAPMMMASQDRAM